jgi:hypothetical protein
LDYETKQQYSVQVKARNTNGYSAAATITIDVKDINEKPILVSSPDINVSDINNSDINISYGEVRNLTFSMNDGDSLSDQTVTVTATASDTNIITLGSITNSPFTNTETSIKLPITGLSPGESNVTVTMIDDGNTSNGGENNTSFTFSVKIRTNGWKIYDDNNYSDPTTPVVFDGITYDWNSTNLWYETTNTILMPIKLISENETNYIGANLNKIADGHYDVNKSDYLCDIKVDEGNGNDSGAKYKNANGDDNNITASNDNFQHDPEHHMFVSRIPLNTDGTIKQQAYIDWLAAADTNYTSAPETNTTYASDVDDSNWSDTSETIDQNNNSSDGDFCANTYGKGWRIPTAYEMGININSNDASYENGFIPAYVGDGSDSDDIGIFSSTKYDDTHHWILGSKSGKSIDEDKTNQDAIRCIYFKY